VALADLVPATPDSTLTVVYVSTTGTNAYTTLLATAPVALADRYFVFINPALDLENNTLAHELHHALFNRGDGAVGQQFFTFNTKAPLGFGVPLPDARIYRRIQNFHTPDPDNDANNNNVINWDRRVRTARFPIPPPFNINPAADNTTGNTLAKDF
jgi:hypothetical protein